MARFMYGRNGADQLCWALFIAELVLSLLPALVPGQAFAAFIHYTTLFLCVYLLFRMFSRNLEKRRAENAKFMQWWVRISFKRTNFFIGKNSWKLPNGNFYSEITLYLCIR